jgi:DNA repair protein RAD7
MEFPLSHLVSEGLMFVKLVAKYIDDVEALGDIAMKDMDRICQIISRNRSLNNNTIRLFLEPQGDRLTLYDCASKSSIFTKSYLLHLI